PRSDAKGPQRLDPAPRRIRRRQRGQILLRWAGQPVMSSAALSEARLARLRDVMAGFVECGEVPGLVALVSRRGETHVEALGLKALGGGDPVRRDTIFRIASMTKPITAVAAMILVEECKLRLDDPVDELLPELTT